MKLQLKFNTLACMMFANDDLVLIGENVKEINYRVDEWRLALEQGKVWIDE